MVKLAQDGLTDREFRDALAELLAGEDAKLWLAKGVGHRVDTVFTIGHGQRSSAKLFDRLGGLFLLGEDVPRRLLPEIHQLFESYYRVHKVKPYVQSKPRMMHVGLYKGHHAGRSRHTMHEISRLNVATP